MTVFDLAGQTQFEGRQHGGGVSVILVDTDVVGAGPRLHRHPYDETFLVRHGTATFTLGDSARTAQAGQVVVAQASTPHKFVNDGPERLEMVNIHANDVFVTEWLE